MFQTCTHLCYIPDAYPKGDCVDECHKRYIRDVGEPLEGGAEKASSSFGMVAFALAAGFVVGLAVWAVYRASVALTNLLWVDGVGAARELLESFGIPTWWLPLAVCGLGGLAIGAFTARFGGEPAPLPQVLATVKRTGGYRLEKPAASVVGFLLPLVFGGAVGPEAGLSGIIAAACTAINEKLKAAGVRIKGAAAQADVTVSAALSAVFATPLAGIVIASQDGMPQAVDPRSFDFHRKAKVVLYTASAIGAAGGVALFGWLFGAEAGLPHLEGAAPGAGELRWGIVCIALGWAGAEIFHASDLCFSALSRRIGDHAIAKPLTAGLALGALAIPLPLVLFPGETQIGELMEGWTALGAAVLVATGLAKCVATPLCINFGWRGGHFFPCIFAGVAIGYGVAAAAGIDPMLCACLACAALVAGVQRNPWVALALLLLFFPVRDIIWLGLACLVGAYLPVPGQARLASAADES